MGHCVREPRTHCVTLCHLGIKRRPNDAAEATARHPAGGPIRAYNAFKEHNMSYIDGELRRPQYRDSTRLLKVEQYAMQRYQRAWTMRHTKAAELFYFAAERCKLLLRANARRNVPAYAYNGRMQSFRIDGTWDEQVQP